MLRLKTYRLKSRSHRVRIGLLKVFIMAALCNRAGHIYFHPVVSSFFLSSFFFSSSNLSRRRLDVCHFHTWCGLSVNLRCRSETCCTQLAENTGCKKVAKNRHLGTIPQLCRAISSQPRHILTIGKKVLSSNTSLTLSLIHISEPTRPY